MLLARRGYRVLLVDRSSFPSDTLSCHYLHQPGVACLKRWGRLPAVAALNCPPVRSQVLDVGPIVLRAPAAPAGDVTDAYAVRRTVLDKMLVDAAAEAGAEVRERFSVDEILSDGERVTGIRGRAAGGAGVTERARIVIGADGMNSLVARSVAAATYEEHPSLTCAYYGYWSGVEMQGAELYARPGQTIIGAPTNDGQVFVIVYWPKADFHRVRARIEDSFMHALELAPGLAERVRSGTRTERFRGTGTLPNFYRRPYGAGWALVGGAVYVRTAHQPGEHFLGIEVATRSPPRHSCGVMPRAERAAPAR